MLRSAALVSRTGKLRWSTVVPRAPWKWRDLFHSRCGGEEEYCGSIPCHWMSLEIDPGTPIWTRGVTSSWLVRLKRPAQVGFHVQTHHFLPVYSPKIQARPSLVVVPSIGETAGIFPTAPAGADLCSASRHQGLDQGFPFSEVSKHQSLLQLRGDEMGARSIPLQAWVESTLFIWSKREVQGFLSFKSTTRKGKTDTYCYGFQDDGPNANTVLGAVWMLHQEGGVVRGESWILPLSLWISPRRFSLI